jgi:hypothetical protein
VKQFSSKIEIFPKEYGFLNDVGAHSSRTIMFKELGMLLDSTSMNAPFNDLKKRVIEDNILQKKSISGRKKTFGFLKQLYGLDPSIPIFRFLRWGWLQNINERPILCLLCALSRDAALRLSAPYILSIAEGSAPNKLDLIHILELSFPNQYSQKQLKSMSENLLSSWTQSGHLVGKLKKIRNKPIAGPISVSYALYLGWLSGVRGRNLLSTPWVEVLNLSDWELRELLQLASKKGWIKYSESGGMVEITFSRELFPEVNNL